MDWELRDKIYESRWYVRGIKEMCQVIENPGVTDIPKSVFLVFEVLCEKVLSLLPEPEEE